MNHVFFGTDNFSVRVLEGLKEADLLPSLIVTAPDRKSGRGQQLQHPPVKIWADENNIPTLQPEKLDDEFIKQIDGDYEIFTLASYGKIIPQEIIDLPKKGMLNVHPSLLPQYRGASPIESAILDDSKEIGVTIMLMDDKMDHGPILNQEFVLIDEWDNTTRDMLADVGGKLLALTMTAWMNDEIEEQEQDHSLATFTKKISKEDGLITIDDIDNNPREVFLKSKAFNPWPGVYFFVNKSDKEIRVKIKDTKWSDGLEILTVVPEGKGEMGWDSFREGYLK